MATTARKPKTGTKAAIKKPATVRKTTATKKSTATTPWEQENPKAKKGTSKKLTPAQKETAQKSAKAAGRPYPNMVDNMKVSRKSSSTKKLANKS